jgi:hypothetical protein
MLASTPPSIQKSGVWHWAAAAPGMNIYVAHSVTRGDGHLVDAWVNRQYFGNIAGIDKNFIELMQFDCAQKMSRRKSTGREMTTPDGGWTNSRAGTSDEGILLVACEHTG